MLTDETIAAKARRLGLDCHYVSPDDCGFRGTSSCCRYSKQERLEPMTTITRDRRKERVVEEISRTLQEWFPSISSDPIAWAFGEAVVERIARVEEVAPPKPEPKVFPDVDIDGTKFVRADIDPCLEKREPGEPMFILLGRDSAAPYAMETWAHQREVEIDLGYRPRNNQELYHVTQVRAKAVEFREWRKANRTPQNPTGRYIPLLRPVSYASFPANVLWRYVEAPTTAGLYNGDDIPRSKYRYGVIETTPPLTPEACKQFGLEAI